MTIEKETFAKIFELENTQVLITKDFEYDEDSGDTDYLLVQTTVIEYCTPRMSHGFKSEKGRDKAFDGYTDGHAKKFVESILDMAK